MIQGECDDFTDAADKVERPKKNVFHGSFCSEDEMLNLFDAIAGDCLELCVKISACYGLLRSEVLGIRRSAVDFERGPISINHKVTESTVDGRQTRRFQIRLEDIITFLERRDAGLLREDIPAGIFSSSGRTLAQLHSLTCSFEYNRAIPPISRKIFLPMYRYIFRRFSLLAFMECFITFFNQNGFLQTILRHPKIFVP